AASAKATLGTALHVLLRLFAPFLPYVTEEVWSWWQAGSVHRAAWPTMAETTVAADGASPELLPLVSTALSQVRGAKSTAQVSMRTEIARALLRAPSAHLDQIRAAEEDLRGAGRIAVLEFEPAEGDDLTVDVTMCHQA